MLSVADFARSSPLKLLPFGGRSCGACSVARAPRLLLCRDADAVLVWRLPAAAAAAELAAAAAANANGAAGAAERAPAAAAELALPRMLLRLKPKLTRRLLFDACLSPTGRYLACVDAEPRLYEVELGGEGDGADGAPPPPPPPSVRRRALPAAARPAACCAFSADERLLLLGGLDGAIQAVAVDAAAAADGADDAAAVHTLRGPPGAAAPPASAAAARVSLAGARGKRGSMHGSQVFQPRGPLPRLQQSSGATPCAAPLLKVSPVAPS